MGRRITQPAARCQNPSLGPKREIGKGQAWILGPSTARRAGRNVSANTTASATTTVPPTPMAQRNELPEEHEPPEPRSHREAGEAYDAPRAFEGARAKARLRIVVAGRELFGCGSGSR